MIKKFEQKQPGVIATTDLSSAKGCTLYWIFFAVLIIVAAISIVPMIWTIATAFKDTQEIYSSFCFFPKNLTFSKAWSRIIEAWTALHLEKSILNTLVMSIGSLVFKLLVCGLGGYALSKIKPKGSKFIFVLVVWTMMMPYQIRMVPNYITCLHFPFALDFNIGINLLDTYWPIWLGQCSDTFAVLLFKNAFDALSDSYVEAARIDGCSNLGIFFKIMVPLSMPTIIYVSIGVLIAAWSDFMGPLIYLSKNEVLPLRIYRLKSEPEIKMNTYFMALVFSCIPTFLIYALFQKKIIGGVNVGGVKG